MGRKIRSEEINDDRLGRCLDACYEHNCDRIFSSIATHVCLRFNVDRKFRHLDATSLDTTSKSVHGRYKKGIGLVKFGYSKDHRSDLRQFLIALIASGDGGIPLFAEVIRGNKSDKTYFREVLQQLKEKANSNEIAYYVADSALYTKETLQTIPDEMRWITRVPETVKQAKDLVRNDGSTID